MNYTKKHPPWDLHFQGKPQLHSFKQKSHKNYVCYLIPGYGFVDTSLTYWGRLTPISVSKLTIIGSDNGLSPGRRQAIIWTNAGILLIGPLGIHFNETSIKIHTFSFKKMHLKLSSGKWRPFCLGLNVLNRDYCQYTEVDILQTFSNACSMWWPSLHPVCIWYHHLKSNIGIYRCQRLLQQTVYLTLSYE